MSDHLPDQDQILRANICTEALGLIGTPYVWAGNDPKAHGGVDCSGLLVYIWRKMGVIKAQMDMSAQTMWELSEPIRKPRLASLAFYGRDEHHVTHVAVFVGLGVAVSARGGNSSCTTPEVALARGACVKKHDPEYRHDFLGYRDFLDQQGEA